jgi:1,4-alpha-glucan branching enzyme
LKSGFQRYLSKDYPNMTHHHPLAPDRYIPGVHFPPAETPVARVWAPRARKLVMEVEGKNPIRLQKKEGGWWEASCPGLQSGDRYFFHINGRMRYPDPASLKGCTGHLNA